MRQASGGTLVRLSVVAQLLWASHAIAQTKPDTTPALIRTSRLFDAERGTMVTGQDILVRRGRIDTIGSGLTAPAGARVIDLRAYTVLPGLIDAHTHLLYLENPKNDLTTEATKAITVEGSLDGPRMYVSGPGLSPFGGQYPGIQQQFQSIVDKEYRVVRGPADAAQGVVENVTLGAVVIKIYSDATPSRGSLGVDDMKAIVEAARRHGVRVAAHATGDAAIWRATEAGVHSIEHGYVVSDSTLAFMKSRGGTVFLASAGSPALQSR